MSKRILILGAGMVSPPLVSYLLENTDHVLTVADQDEKRPEKLLANTSRGRALGLDIAETAALEREISTTDLVISLLPSPFHPQVAAACISAGKDLLTASYAGEPMRALEAEAQAAGISILCELGLDPGLDHMEAMRVIHEIESQGGRVLSFISYCGGLPAPEANTNPLGYKFSWSPLGVLLASRSSARYLQDGSEIEILPENLFLDPVHIPIEGIGEFHGYPNRDSLPYRELYGIPGSKTLLRGTLRYPGWCEFMLSASRLGLLDDSKRDWSGFTYRSFLGSLLGITSGDDVAASAASYLNLPHSAPALQCLEWLGFYQDEILPVKQGSALEVLAGRMQEKMQYARGERDMIILRHEFLAETQEGVLKKVTSTLVDYGIPGGDSAMARTVGLPLAVAAKLMLQENDWPRGICIPVLPQIYQPILKELQKFDIHFTSAVENVRQ
jgi:saccharopine dehydrogenase (NADP+, L-glutamate forming)/spermidine synthase